MEEFCFVMSVSGPKRPNTGMDDERVALTYYAPVKVYISAENVFVFPVIFISL
jgi:hypothetical protein